MDKKQIVNTCYILGNALLVTNKVSYFQVELIKEQLKNINTDYIITLGTENTMATIDEWHDFFMTDENNDIHLTDNSVNARNTVSLLFTSALSIELQLDILRAVSEVKSKKYIKLIK